MDINGNVAGGSGANQQLNTDSDVQFGQITVRDYTFPTDTPSSGQIIKESNGSLIWTQDDGGVLPQALATTDKPTFAGLTISDNIKPYNLPGTGGVQGDLIQIQADNLNTSFVPTEDLFGQDLSQSGDVGFNTITSSQTVFTNDNEVVTKKYVDDQTELLEFEKVKVVEDLPAFPTSLTWDDTVYPYTSVTFANAGNQASFLQSINKREIVTKETFYAKDLAVGGYFACWVRATGRQGGNLAVGINFVNSKTQFEGGGVGFVTGANSHNQNGRYVLDGLATENGNGKTFSSTADLLFEIKVVKLINPSDPRDPAIDPPGSIFAMELRVTTDLTGATGWSTNRSSIGFGLEKASLPLRFYMVDWFIGDSSINSITLTNVFQSGYTPTDIQYRILVDEEKFAIKDEFEEVDVLALDGNTLEISKPFQAGGNIRGYSNSFNPPLGCVFSLYRGCPSDDITTTTSYQDMIKNTVNPWNYKGSLTFPPKFLGDIDLINIKITGTYTLAGPDTTFGIKLIIREQAVYTLVEKTAITLPTATKKPFFLEFNACQTRRSGQFTENEWLSSLRYETADQVIIVPGDETLNVSHVLANTIMPQVKAQGVAVFTPVIVNATFSSSL